MSTHVVWCFVCFKIKYTHLRGNGAQLSVEPFVKKIMRGFRFCYYLKRHGSFTREE